MTETKKPNSRMKEVLSKLGPLLALALICIALAISAQGKFVTPANIVNLLRQVPIVALMSVGMLCVILLGGIDLSAGSLLAISTGVTAVLMKKFFSADTVGNSILPVVICLAVGTVAGIVYIGRLNSAVPLASQEGDKVAKTSE